MTSTLIPTTCMAGAGRDGGQKRFLIMTYSSEFDRVHFPLALVYAGKQDKNRALLRRFYAVMHVHD